jgi:hypothetical protein
MRLNASGTPRVRIPAARNFMLPLYQTRIPGGGRPREIEPSDGFNPLDYIMLSPRLSGRHRVQIYRLSGATAVEMPQFTEIVAIITESEDDEGTDTVVEADPDFQPVPFDTVDRQLVESVTIVQR